jgi:hypothetical protein
MSSTAAKGWLAAIAALLAVPAPAAAVRPTAGAFISTQADVHVAKRKIVSADINCAVQGAVTIQAIDLSTPIRIRRSGSFRYRGSATYVHSTSTGYKRQTANVTLKGTFPSSTQVRGTVSGGPGACASVTFVASYNANAH